MKKGQPLIQLSTKLCSGQYTQMQENKGLFYVEMIMENSIPYNQSVQYYNKGDAASEFERRLYLN